MRRGVLLVFAAFLLSACDVAPVEQPRPIEIPAATSRPSTVDTPQHSLEPLYTPEPPRAVPETCDGQRVRVRPGIVQAATGARYLLLKATNCADESLILPALPELRMTSSGGASWSLELERHQPGQESLTLAPGDTGYIGLQWRAVGRGPARAHRLEVTFVGPATTLVDDFAIAPDTVITVHPWARSPEEAWES